MLTKLKTIVVFFNLKRIVIIAGSGLVVLAISMHLKALDVAPPKAALVPTLQYLTASDLNTINAQIKFMGSEIDRLRKGQVAIGEDFVGRLEKIETWQAKASPVTTGSTSKAKR